MSEIIITSFKEYKKEWLKSTKCYDSKHNEVPCIFEDNILERRLSYKRKYLPNDMYIEPVRMGMGFRGPLKTPWFNEYIENIFEFYSQNDMAWNDETAKYCKKTSADNEKNRKKALEKTDGEVSTYANKARGSLLGLMVGDAFGMPLEFQKRDTSVKIEKFESGGPFNLEAGQYTDDSSMAFCLAYSLIKNKGFDLYHQALSYVNWYKYGAFRPVEFFDIGVGTKEALDNFINSGEPIQGSTDPYSSGNGCIMKLAPVPIFYAYDYEKAIKYSEESARITHQSEDSLSACKYMGGMIAALVNGVSKESVLSELYHPIKSKWKQDELSSKVYEIAKGSFKNKSRDEIKSSGYVIDTLEAALWAFYNTNTFYEGLVLAVNLAGDADTIGAVYGQIAGAYYGEFNIPYYFIRFLKDSHHPYHIVQDFQELKMQ